MKKIILSLLVIGSLTLQAAPQADGSYAKRLALLALLSSIRLAEAQLPAIPSGNTQVTERQMPLIPCENTRSLDKQKRDRDRQDPKKVNDHNAANTYYESCKLRLDQVDQAVCAWVVFMIEQEKLQEKLRDRQKYPYAKAGKKTITKHERRPSTCQRYPYGAAHFCPATRGKK